MFQNLLNKLFGDRKAPRTRSNRTSSKGTLPAPGPPRTPREPERIDPHATPEALCGLRDGMTKDELREHLATLYRRHNRAASSLDDNLRGEAEIMLEAIVACRERYLGGD